MAVETVDLLVGRTGDERELHTVHIGHSVNGFSLCLRLEQYTDGYHIQGLYDVADMFHGCKITK